MDKKQGRFYWHAGLLALCLGLFLVSPAAALETRSGNMVYVPDGSVKGPLFVSGENLTIDADVDGDVFAAGQSVVVNGNVNGDVIAAGNSVNVNGAVTGDIRAAANTIELNGAVGGSITGAGNNIFLRRESQISRDALLLGNTVNISGAVAGQVMGFANQMDINHSIAGDVMLWDVKRLSIGPSAVMGGKVTYRSAQQAQIDPAAQVGSVTRLTPPPRPERTGVEAFSWWGSLLWFAAGLLLWGGLCLLFPRLFPHLEKTTGEWRWATLGWGFLALLLIPLGSILLMITVVGIPLAFILLVAYILTLALAKIMVSDMAARYATRRWAWESRFPLAVPFAAVFLVFIILGKIPILGFILNLILICLALGVLILSIYNNRKTPPALPLPPASASE